MRRLVNASEIEISRDDFEVYESLRKTGIVNMCHVSRVSMITGISRTKVTAILHRYKELVDLYGRQ